MQQKRILDTDLTSLTFTKTISEWIIDINIKYKTIELVEDNVRENLNERELGNDFLDTSKAQSIKEIDRLDFIKIKNVCFSN